MNSSRLPSDRGILMFVSDLGEAAAECSQITSRMQAQKNPKIVEEEKGQSLDAPCCSAGLRSTFALWSV